jgi:hypothetical protein
MDPNERARDLLKGGVAQLRDSWRWLLALYAPIGFLLLAASVVSLTVPGVSLYLLMSDPTAAAGVPFYTGCLSQLGILLWCATATTIWLACFILGGSARERGQTRRFLLLSGAFVTVLMLDDLYLLHEEVIDTYLHVPEDVLLVGYAVLGVVFLWSSRSEILRGEYGLFLLGLGLLGASNVCDLVPDALYAGVKGMQKAETLIEEGSKLIGVATWLAFYVRYASRQLRGLERGAGAPSASARVA